MAGTMDPGRPGGGAAFPAALAPADLDWVEATFASMSLEEKVGHLLCPESREMSAADWTALLKEVPLGCVFFPDHEFEGLAEKTAAIQAASRIPVIVAADIENGLPQGTRFTTAMGFGAAGDPALARAKGRAVAREARSSGIHWTFAPVIDLCLNHNNPETQVRAFGDQPGTVAALALAQIQGLQEGGALAATAKHFPGAGLDDRDQHLCTAVMDLEADAWRASYGKVWRAAIEGGVLSVMAGHISFPDYEGLGDRPSAALPATLSRRLQVDLLRGELGFGGVLVSDAAPMLGMTSRVRAEDQAVENILAGSDCFLFAEPRADFARLMAAARSGRLSLERIDASVRRILMLKAALGVHQDAFGRKADAVELGAHADLARTVAEASIVIHRPDKALPAALAGGSKVLTVTMDNQGKRPDLAVIDEELKRRGFQVEHLRNPDHHLLLQKAAEADRIFVNFRQEIHSPIGEFRLAGSGIMGLWRAFWLQEDRAVFTSFGSPYHLYELPHLPNMAYAWSPSDASQRAAVAAWLGEAFAKGRCPVRLPRGL